MIPEGEEIVRHSPTRPHITPREKSRFLVVGEPQEERENADPVVRPSLPPSMGKSQISAIDQVSGAP